MTSRFLVNEDGHPFHAVELSAIAASLACLSIPDRKKFRDENAEHIAQHEAPRMLVVSGPGTGKSTLFKQRIDNWLTAEPSATVLAVSFVRKLVEDLASDISSDGKLTSEQKKQVSVHTLHKYARSLVEKNHGTQQHPLQSHFAIISPSWKDMVWRDAQLQVEQPGTDAYSRKEFEHQLHDAVFDDSDEWRKLTESYFDLCAFYNAVGFADLILRATSVMRERPDVDTHQFFIVDEYQDFNQAEEELIVALTRVARGVLIAGDDDQVLYDRLKSGKAQLVRALYAQASFANGLLPFCSRCGYHIVKASEHFANRDRDADRIPKLFLPLRDSVGSTKIQIVACARPTGAVAYVEQFVAQHAQEIEGRKAKLESGEEKDAFLLVLSPARDAKFYGDEGERLRNFIAQYRSADMRFSDDYFRVLTYYSAATHPWNNFALRKVLSYEGVSPDVVAGLVRDAMRERLGLSALEAGPAQHAVKKTVEVRAILMGSVSARRKAAELALLVAIEDPEHLGMELDNHPIGAAAELTAQAREEEDAELEELDVRRMSAVELMTIVGSKGLSADHVIVVGADDVNMSYVSKNAFYVAMTRARQSLHIVCALGARGSKAPHAFLSELPDDHLDFMSFKKTAPQVMQLANRAAFAAYLARALAVRSSPTRRKRHP